MLYEQKLSVKSEVAKSAKQSLLQVEHHIKNLAEILKYAEQYKSNYPFYAGYKKANNPDAYFRKHESEILFSGAKRMLEQAETDLKSLNVNKLKLEYQELESKKKNCLRLIKCAKKKCVI